MKDIVLALRAMAALALEEARPLQVDGGVQRREEQDRLVDARHCRLTVHAPSVDLRERVRKGFHA